MQSRRMTMLLALMLLSSGPRSIAQATPVPAPPQVAPQPVCVVRRFTAIAVDPVAPVDVNTTQQFAIALRVVADAGFTWRLVDPLAANAPVRADGDQTLWDVALQNLDRKPGDPPAVGGAATQLFLFTATNPGQTTLTLGSFGPGADKPDRTTTFTVRVSPNVAVC